VKPTALAIDDFSTKGFDLGFFCGAGFLRPLGLDEIKFGIPNDHVSGVVSDKTMVRVLTIAPITKASAQVQEPRGVDERLNLQHG
jgi:hypothetical protein